MIWKSFNKINGKGKEKKEKGKNMKINKILELRFEFKDLGMDESFFS